MSVAESKASAPVARREAFNAGGLALLVLVTLLWGANWPVMKVTIAEIPIWTYRSLCLLGGSLGIFAVAYVAGHRLRVPKGELRPLIVVSLFNVTLWHLCSAAGLTHLSAGRASIIAFTMPLWAALLATRVLGEQLVMTTIAGLIVGLLGLAALLLPEWQTVIADPLGPALMLAAAFAWAIGTVAIKYYCFTMPVTVLTGWQLFIGGAPIVFGAIIFEGGFDPTTVSANGWMLLAYTITAAMVFCQWAWFKLVSIYPAALAAVSTLAIPVVGVVSSAFLLGEPIGLDILAALVLVLIALFLVVAPPILRRRSSATNGARVPR